jgi:hypothetical protein
VWYFNPLAWQFLFIIGFSFGMGWLKAPPLRDRRLVALALAIMVASIPAAFWGFTNAFPALAAIEPMLGHDGSPTSLHPLRLMHFLSLAYLALSAIEPWRARLPQIAALKPIERVGQQTLAAFLASLPIAWTIGILLDWAGRGAFTVTLANLAALGGIFLTARIVEAFKRQPWREGKGQPPQRAQQGSVAPRPTEAPTHPRALQPAE